MVFLSSESQSIALDILEDILSAIELDKTKFYPLYGLLTNDEQAKAIAPSRTGQRKVVLATQLPRLR